MAERVAVYDADMDVMHPNRSLMVRAALEILPFGADEPLRALDLGTGTGFFAAAFLNAFPAAQVVAVDGSAEMIELARARLGKLEDRLEPLVGDFRQLCSLLEGRERFDVVFSSFALHHLNREEKTALARDVGALLMPGGWFLNADLVKGTPHIEERFQELRVRGIVERANGSDDRFADRESTRRHLDQLEAADGDQPLGLEEDLQIFRAGGFREICPIWLALREAVIASVI